MSLIALKQFTFPFPHFEYETDDTGEGNEDKSYPFLIPS